MYDDTMKIKKGKKIIKFPYPINGEIYNPTELCKNLMEFVDPEDRRFVIKELYHEMFITVKYDAVLKHLQKYKKGLPLP